MDHNGDVTWRFSIGLEETILEGPIMVNRLQSKLEHLMETGVLPGT